MGRLELKRCLKVASSWPENNYRTHYDSEGSQSNLTKNMDFRYFAIPPNKTDEQPDQTA